ncbi:MAG: putative DNA-binding domain-containing protein [Myxococcales bacterium]|nr:putative DNA-binding domain-containing protein [Myxococcota bacterium]MDW8280746.1 putative DNA-binding domain-containing protein [Myxococcales bacterium]
MNLERFFALIGPLLHGQAGLAETIEQLYGEAARGPHARDAQRLGLYARFCRIHRFEVIESVYPHCREVVISHAGEATWQELVEAYFRAHPMRSFVLNENGAHWPAFLVSHAGGLPPFLPELADLEWWEWQTLVAPDGPEDATPDQGPLRLSSTVELRRYEHDLLGWLDAEPSARGPAPQLGQSLVLFWRDREQRARRERAYPLELLVLRAVNAGEDPAALAQQPGGPSATAIAETIDDLAKAGILLGRYAGSSVHSSG